MCALTLFFQRGSDVRVACKASGNPLPDIQWLRQGRPVSENRYDIDYADLTLAGVDSSHKGLYTCVASNEGGSDDRRITVDVLGKYHLPTVCFILFRVGVHLAGKRYILV